MILVWCLCADCSRRFSRWWTPGVNVIHNYCGSCEVKHDIAD